MTGYFARPSRRRFPFSLFGMALRYLLDKIHKVEFVDSCETRITNVNFVDITETSITRVNMVE